MSEPLTKHSGHLVEGLVWKDKKPTVEGTYWYRWNQRDPQPMAMSFTQSEIDNDELAGFGEWSGPITLPIDAPAQDWYRASEVLTMVEELRQQEVDGLKNMHYIDACDAMLDQLRKGRG